LEGGITSADFDDAVVQITQDFADEVIYSLSLNQLDIGEAENLAKHYAIQGIDALILAFGIHMWKDRWDFVFFVTSDLNLASAARNEGFSTYFPRTDLVCHSSGVAFEPNR
jgi:hypothetical protein